MGFLTKDTEVVTKAELAEFYTKIYPWLGTNNPSTTGAIDKAYMFSTDEKLIGQWIDGKPLYQKVVQLNPVTASSAAVSTPHGISNLGDVVELRGIWHANHQWFMTLPRAESSIKGAKATNTIDMYAGPEYIMIAVGEAFGTMTGAWAIIRYTKSTDTAVSIGNENNYSTGETIVGTWIDGKPLYQRTIIIDNPAFTGGDRTRVYEKYWALNTSVDIPVSVDCMEMQKTLNKWGRLPLSYSTDGDTNLRTMWIYLVFNGNTATSNPNSIGICWNGDLSWIAKLMYTIKYTKTTD